MNTQYKYIHFIVTKHLLKTDIWSCRNNKTGIELGLVKWYSPWRQYCFITTAERAVYSGGCLDDIKAFVDALNAERVDNR